MPTEKQLKYWDSLKGRKLSEEHRARIGVSNIGKHREPKKPQQGFQIGHKKFIGAGVKKGERLNEKHPLWKENGVSLSGLHAWVERKLGKPDTCEHCKKTGLKGHKIHWANKYHTYQRSLEDWLRLCVSCHRIYDFRYNNYQLKRRTNYASSK